MGWVLLVVLWSGPYERPILTTQQFISQAACEDAQRWVREKTKRYTVEAVCKAQQ